MIKVYLPHYDALISIDLGDLPILSAHKWYVRNLGNSQYVTRNEGGRTLFLHREIMSPAPELIVDHIDGSGLNNTRGNMRVLKHRQNLWNRTRHEGSIGVSWSKRMNAWRSYIEVETGKLDLGFYQTEDEAMIVRDLVSMKLRGSIGTLNFKDGDIREIDCFGCLQQRGEYSWRHNTWSPSLKRPRSEGDP